MFKIKKLLIPFSIFIIALLPRIVSLGVTATADQELWIPRSLTFIKNVLRHNWNGTVITGHPGVTTMWLSGISLYLHSIYLKSMDGIRIFFAAEFPIALVTSIIIILLYYLIKKIFNQKIAFVASLFIALDPFLIAHSRCVHLDALLSSFMIVSVLFFLTYLTDSSKISYIVCSGFFAGLAFLTKLPSLFLFPFIALTIGFWHLPQIFKSRDHTRKIRALFIVKICVIWLAISIATFIVLWPAMWIQPKQAINLMYSGIQTARIEPHGSSFFMGKISDGTYRGFYGLFFYIISIIIRLTPITLSFFIFYSIHFLREFKRRGYISVNKNTFLLFCYVLFFTLMVSLVAKKGSRYALPIFPVIDILAAMGLCHFVSIIVKRIPFKTAKYKNILASVVFICAVGLQAGPSLSLQPYYLAYYNPLAGGPSLAKKILTVGWGEGMDIAARYLNKKPNAKDLTIAVQYTAFRPYFAGKTIWMDYFEQGKIPADYLVFYISALQRRWHYPLWEKYKDKMPEYVVRINNIDYAWIYKVEK